MRRISFVLPFPLLLALGVAPVAAPQTARGFDPANMDTSVSPCADFFQYAVGAWGKRTTIPAEYSKYGVDQEVEERTFGDLERYPRRRGGGHVRPQGFRAAEGGGFFRGGDG